MAKKNFNVDYSDPPETLENHIFYGLQLDEQQKEFRDAIWSTDKLIVFCDAKAGSGKTTIATATANLLVKYGRYKNIVYVASPTQEQKQGYLAGSLQDKSEPYFEPFYEALVKIGVDPICCKLDDINNQKNGVGYIKCVTHTFLRGCNFEESIVIIDESQNFFGDELRKVLTRIHDSCKVIVIGHSGQIDLYTNSHHSGFVAFLNHYKDDPRCAVCKLTKNYRGWISSWADELEWNY